MGKSQPKSSVVGLGTESIVYLNTSSQFPTVTKNRRTNGKTQYRFEGFVYQALAKLGAHVPILISVSDDELVMSAFSGATIDDQIDLYEEVEIFRDIAKDLAPTVGYYSVALARLSLPTTSFVAFTIVGEFF